MDQRIHKKERLKKRSLIEQLFKEGQTFSCYPFKAIWMINLQNQETGRIQLAISVPKRFFKSAVKRNLIRRRAREAYRLNKANLFAELPPEGHFGLMLIYIAKEELEFPAFEKGIQKLMIKLPLAINAAAK